MLDGIHDIVKFSHRDPKIHFSLSSDNRLKAFTSYKKSAEFILKPLSNSLKNTSNLVFLNTYLGRRRVCIKFSLKSHQNQAEVSQVRMMN